MTTVAARVRSAVAAAGFVVEDFVELPDLPPPMAVWKPFLLASATPAARIPCGDPDHDDQVDRAWWGLSSGDGTMVLSVEGAGGLPWLRARTNGGRPRASAVGLPGHSKGFAALSLDGRVSTAVSSEEWETWIFAGQPVRRSEGPARSRSG
ncbi:hypothetical protein AB0J83_23615 [Actinoplanes sp. NPDC049596]|uniref:hypothetical protein n=1 Tax=unclassified Actinoplanes TaxID=2626549 RepID=UPI00343D3D29